MCMQNGGLRRNTEYPKRKWLLAAPQVGNPWIKMQNFREISLVSPFMNWSMHFSEPWIYWERARRGCEYSLTVYNWNPTTESTHLAVGFACANLMVGGEPFHSESTHLREQPIMSFLYAFKKCLCSQPLNLHMQTVWLYSVPSSSFSIVQSKYWQRETEGGSGGEGVGEWGHNNIIVLYV